MARRDDLDDFVAERTRANADFSAMVEEALARRQLLRALTDERQAE